MDSTTDSPDDLGNGSGHVHTGEPFALNAREIPGEHVTVQTAKRSELHTFKVMSQH